PLRDYARNRPDLIKTVKAPARVFIPGRTAITAPEPDIAVYGVFPTHIPRRRVRWQDISPMLVAEVLSDENAEKDLVRNLEFYRQVPKIREYWIVDPREDADRPTMTVYRRRGRGWARPVVVPAGGTYTSPLLPDFTLSLASQVPPADEG